MRSGDAQFLCLVDGSLVSHDILSDYAMRALSIDYCVDCPGSGVFEVKCHVIVSFFQSLQPVS